jgi:hypothetical protein
MPSELGDSWFSPKCLEGQPRVLARGGKALMGLGAVRLPPPVKPGSPRDRARE